RALEVELDQAGDGEGVGVDGDAAGVDLLGARKRRVQADVGLAPGDGVEPRHPVVRVVDLGNGFRRIDDGGGDALPRAHVERRRDDRFAAGGDVDEGVDDFHAAEGGKIVVDLDLDVGGRDRADVPHHGARGDLLPRLQRALRQHEPVFQDGDVDVLAGDGDVGLVVRLVGLGDEVLRIDDG